jgi:hypothetical protein
VVHRGFIQVGRDILDLPVALGENRYRLSIMGAANARSIATAVARATGVTP